MELPDGMKSELVRIQTIGNSSNHIWSHGRSTLHLCSGEIYSFFGSSISGKNELSAMLEGLSKPRNTEISILGRKIAAPDEIRRNVHTMAPVNYSIANWTIAEYLLLTASKPRVPFLRPNAVILEAQDIVDRLGFSMDVRKKMNCISEHTKRIVDIVKAYIKNAVILLIKDPFEGVGLERIREFRELTSSLLHRGALAVVNTPSESVNRMLGDHYIFFRNGNIVRKIAADTVDNDDRLKKALFESGIGDKSRSEERTELAPFSDNEAFAAQGIHFSSGRSFSLELQRGQVAMIIVPDRRDKLELFTQLSGREVRKGVVFRVDGRLKKLRSIADFVEYRIVSSENIGTENELFPGMTADENILIPSLSKISGLWYLLAGKRIRQSVAMDYTREFPVIDTEHHIRTVFTRWMVFRPRVLILLDPFVQCGASGEHLITSFIRRLTSRGTIIIIIQSRERDIGIAGSKTYHITEEIHT